MKKAYTNFAFMSWILFPKSYVSGSFYSDLDHSRVDLIYLDHLVKIECLDFDK